MFDLIEFLVDLCKDPARVTGFIAGAILPTGFVGWLWLRSHQTSIKRCEDLEKDANSLEKEIQDLKLIQRNIEREARFRNLNVDELIDFFSKQERLNQHLKATLLPFEKLADDRGISLVEIIEKYNSLENQIFQEKGKSRELQLNIEKLHQECDELTKTISGQREVIGNYTTKFAEFESQQSRLNDEIGVLSREKETAYSKNGELQQQLNDANQRIARHSQEIEDSNGRLSQEKEQLLTELRAANSKLNQDNENQQQQIAQLQEELRKARDLTSQTKDEARALRQELADANHRLQSLKDRIPNESVSELKQTIVRQQDQISRLEEDLLSERNLQSHTKANAIHLQEKLDEANEKIEVLANRVASKEAPTNGVLGNGPNEETNVEDWFVRVWERSVDLNSIPRFVPKTKRKTRFVSVLNLKGGVGKTTITTNLGATLWTDPNKVLLVDLDFQGSLTARCSLPANILNYSSGAFFQNVGNVDSLVDSFWSMVQPITFEGLRQNLVSQRGLKYLMAAGETLEMIETGLLLKWFIDLNCMDIRFHLLEALHDPRTLEKVDYVILDCPPRMTTACINALATSDCVLIPVMLDKTSYERVPVLITWLSNLRKSKVCKHLEDIVVVANGVAPNRHNKLTAAEKSGWDEVYEISKSIKWDGNLHFLESVIHDNPRISDAANEHFPAVLRDTMPFDAVRKDFRSLANELRERAIL